LKKRIELDEDTEVVLCLKEMEFTITKHKLSGVLINCNMGSWLGTIVTSEGYNIYPSRIESHGTGMPTLQRIGVSGGADGKKAMRTLRSQRTAKASRRKQKVEADSEERRRGRRSSRRAGGISAWTEKQPPKPKVAKAKRKKRSKKKGQS